MAFSKNSKTQITPKNPQNQKSKECSNTITSRCILNEKESHDGQKANVKAWIVARGFHKEEFIQSDSPTVLKDSLKGLFVIAANMKHQIASIDIKGAFLQSDELDREVFLEPTTNMKKENLEFYGNWTNHVVVWKTCQETFILKLNQY